MKLLEVKYFKRLGKQMSLINDIKSTEFFEIMYSQQIYHLSKYRSQ